MVLLGGCCCLGVVARDFWAIVVCYEWFDGSNWWFWVVLKFFLVVVGCCGWFDVQCVVLCCFENFMGSSRSLWIF